MPKSASFAGAVQQVAATDGRPPSLRSVWRPQLNAGTLGGRVDEMTPSVLRVLLLIERRPEMYLGPSASRGRQLDVLQGILSGYTLALHQHRLPNDDLATISRLEEHMRERLGVEGAPIAATRAAATSDEEAWARVWEAISSFAEAETLER